MKKTNRFIKNSIWKAYAMVQFSTRPFHPILRLLLFKARIVRHGKRQPYLLGFLNENRSAKDLKNYLLSEGFETMFAYWVDEGEVFGLRYRANFEFQYHIRLYNNGEVRCHYEITPEEAPLDHLTDRYTERRRDDFMNWLQDWIIPTDVSDDFILEKTISQRAPAPSRTGPENG